jgi:hypothetical protein
MTATPQTPIVDSEPPADGPAPGRARRLLRAVRAVRPLAFLAPVPVLVVLAGVPEYDPTDPRFEYAIRAGVVALVGLGAAAWWWSARRGETWGPDLAPALLGGIGGLTLVGYLSGTPYAPGGLSGDQSFRTAAITRFADSWQNADFTFQGLPSFYAPAYFWVLGRTADLAAIEPWRMTKYGTVLVTLLMPLLAYLLWRRLVPDHAAALIAVVPLLVQNFYEPYSWLVLFAIVPWWLEAVHGLRRPAVRPAHPLLLGLIGAVLFLTYYYFFFIAAIALVIHLIVERALGQLSSRQVRSAALALLVAAAGSAVFWAPLLVSILRAAEPESLANRWFNAGHTSLPLPMLEASVIGAVSLLGLGHLLWTVRRDPLSRGLLVFLAAAYCWYLIGAPAVVANTPLLSFRGKPLIPMILAIAGILALVRIGGLAVERFGRTDVLRVGWVVGVALVVFVGQGFVTEVRDTPLLRIAHATAWPDGRLPPYHTGAVFQPDPPATVLHQAISDRYAGEGNPVLLSDRRDIMALYPYYGFLQWGAHYAHPAAEFHSRVSFLEELAGSATPAEFAARSGQNRFDRIDAFVLRQEGDELVLRFNEDAFEGGSRDGVVRFPRALFAPAAFELAPLGGHLLAVRR